MLLPSNLYSVPLFADQVRAIDAWLTEKEITPNPTDPLSIGIIRVQYENDHKDRDGSWPDELKPLEHISPELFRDILVDGYWKRPDYTPTVKEPRPDAPEWKITTEYLEDVLSNLSSSENIGASDALSGLIPSVCAEIIGEEDEPTDAFDFGHVEAIEAGALHLDEFDIPVIWYELRFMDLGVALPIEARRSSLWYYYPGSLVPLTPGR